MLREQELMLEENCKNHTPSLNKFVKRPALCVHLKARETAEEATSHVIECTRQGCKYQYIGETSRNGISRGKEHLKGLEKRDQDSVLVQHIQDFHQSDFSQSPCHQFKMSITLSHETTISRLVTEAVKIEMSTKPLMNRKRGYCVNSVLSLSSLSDVSHC